jgi:hypothetical protein
MKELKMPSKFIFPFKSPLSFKENVTHYFESIKAKIEKGNEFLFFNLLDFTNCSARR